MKNDLLQRFDLSGKVAVITDAGGELCGAVAEGLGTLGVNVAILDIRPEKAAAQSSTSLP
jgi:NAD(P)-dependent dehydrogenase (short-subunit alcohol dehydrogenase family)